MRRRSFVPEALAPLEGRALLSRAPVPLSGLGFNANNAMLRGDFEEFATSGNLARLRFDLTQRLAAVPFGFKDGLGPVVRSALSTLQRDLAAGTPAPVTTAYQTISGAIKADVQARIDDGSIVLRP